MNKRTITLMVLLLSSISLAQVTSPTTSFVGSFATFFNPLQYIHDSQNSLNGILAVTLKWGAGLVVVLMGLEFARRYFTEEGFSLSNSIRTFVLAGGIMVILYPIKQNVVNSTGNSGNSGSLPSAGAYTYETFFANGMLFPLDQLTTDLAKSNMRNQLDQQQNYLNSLGSNLQNNKLKLAVSLLASNYVDIIVAPLVILGWAIAWVMSFYIDIVCALLYAVGPLFIPFFVFRPMSSIGWSWLRTFISYPIMAIFGNVIFTMMCSQNIYVEAVNLASANKFLHAVPYLLTQVLVMIMIPSIVSGIMSSVAPSITAAAKSFAGGMKTAADTVQGSAAALGMASASSQVAQGITMYQSGVSASSPDLLEKGQAMINRGTQLQFASEERFRKALPTVASVLSVGNEPHGSYARRAATMSPEEQRSAMAHAIQNVDGVEASAQFREDTQPGGPGQGLAAGALPRAMDFQQGFSTAAQRARRAIESSRPMELSSLRDVQSLGGKTPFRFENNSQAGNSRILAEMASQRFGVPGAQKISDWMTDSGFTARSETGSFKEDAEANLAQALKESGLSEELRPNSPEAPGDHAHTLAEVTQFNKGMDFDFTKNTPENNRRLLKEYTKERFGNREAEHFENAAAWQEANITVKGGGMKTIHEAVVQVYQKAGLEYGMMEASNPVDRPVLEARNDDSTDVQTGGGANG